MIYLVQFTWKDWDYKRSLISAGRKGKAEEMHCPVCDRLTAVPGGHVCCFPPNAGTLKILEVFKVRHWTSEHGFLLELVDCHMLRIRNFLWISPPHFLYYYYQLVEAHKKDFVPCIGCDDKAEARCLECQVRERLHPYLPRFLILALSLKVNLFLMPSHTMPSHTDA